MKIFLLLFFALTLVAQDISKKEYSLRLAYGVASSADLGGILTGNFSSHEKNLSVISLDGGYLLKESLFDWPVDLYVKGGVSRFDQSAANVDTAYEMLLYIKAYWNFDFLDNRVRLGLGEGGSYVTHLLYDEKSEADSKGEKSAYYLNYLDISVDFDFGRLIGYKPLYETHIGWAIKHRSGIAGLINGVKTGGSNYNTIYIEKNF